MFQHAMNAICVDYHGLEIKKSNIVIDRRSSKIDLNKTLYEYLKTYNKVGGKWYSLFGVIRNALNHPWKYRDIAQNSMASFLWAMQEV